MFKNMRIVLFVLFSGFLISCGSSGGDSSVLILPTVKADFKYTGTDMTVSFVNKSVAIVSDIESYLWDFGDGNTSAEKDPVHTYTAVGTYKVKLTVTNSVKQTSFMEVSVTVPVQTIKADFNYSIDSLVVDFTSTSVGAINAYLWDFGDGSTSAERDPKHTYAAKNTYNVKLTVTDGADKSETVTKSVDVLDIPKPLVTVDFTSTANNDTKVVQFTDTTAVINGTIVSHSWDFADNSAASTEKSPSHTYADGGIYEVTLTVTDNSGVKHSKTNKVMLRNIDFTMQYEGVVVTLTDSSVIDNAVSYSWIIQNRPSATGKSTVVEVDPLAKTSVTLTVTDAKGTQYTKTKEINVKLFNKPFVGETYTFAIEEVTRKLYAWGNNDKGQLGSGDTVNKSKPTLVKLPSGTDVDKVVLGKDFTLLLFNRRGDELYVWGKNDKGQLGVGDNIDRMTPTLVRAPTDMKFAESSINSANIHVGDDFVIAKCIDIFNPSITKYYVWGANDRGQLGLGDNNNRNTPTELPAIPNFRIDTMTVGGKSVVATGMGPNGTASYAWGANTNGLLGVGDTLDKNVPTEMLRIADSDVPDELGNRESARITSMLRLESFAFGVAANTPYIWGKNDKGQLGFGDVLDRTIATQVFPDTQKEELQVYTMKNSVLMGALFGPESSGTRKYYVWGANDKGQLGIGSADPRIVSPVEFTKFAFTTDAFFTGSDHIVTLRNADKKLYVWGANDKGQLGLGNNDNKNTPQEVTVTKVGEFKEIVTGYDQTFITTNKGALFVTGDNTFGQLGLGHTDKVNTLTLLRPSAE